MADTGKQSPLGVNVLGSVLQNTGLTINPVAASYMGASKTNSDYAFGSLVQNTVLRLLTWAINDGWVRQKVDSGTYNNLISIGLHPVITIPALGNARAPTYIVEDPAGVWTTLAVASGGGLPGPATSGYPISGNTGQGQEATWIPYDTTNPNASVTQWGYIRLHALQAWNEFNWNGSSVTLSNPEYKEFCASFMNANGFISYSNQAINALNASKNFLQGVYSNMDDLISADISGVTLSCYYFGTDCINLGKVINLADIATFGLPSNLLRNLGKNNAVTQDLSLALIASGLSSNDIAAITTGTAQSISQAQEQQIYGAFLIITGENLTHVLAPMQCNTTGFNTLADLLNPVYLFPNSYTSLTVPVYNAEQGLPTNSKTYYLIYSNGGLNNALNTPAIKSYVGTQLPTGTPPTTNKTLSPSNYNVLPTGFGSYLNNIIPADQATACGAFSVAMRQIRNIQYFDFQKFARVVQGIENTTGLTQVNGTNKPTDTALSTAGNTICALGTGPNGTYTFSDMFGCMSGLPYAWSLMFDRITQLQTTKLHNIYQQLFLAVTWKGAVLPITQTVYNVEVQPYIPPDPSAMPPVAGQPRIDHWYYTVSITMSDPGGGYGRGTAPVPTVTLTPNNCNASVSVLSFGQDDNNAASNGGGTFGRITGINVNNGTPYLYQTTSVSQPDPPVPPTPPVESVIIQSPPTATLPVNSNGTVATGGTNTSGTETNTLGVTTLLETGWPTMDGPVQGYIDQANAEITSIEQNNIDASTHLNTYYNQAGVQLKIEQRARYTGIVPVPVPKNYFMNVYPVTCYAFVDSVPSLSQDTSPHMAAQTIEAISDPTTTGGQSLVAQGRQERNQNRLQVLGIGPDNNMPDTLSPTDLKTLLSNGTLPTAVPGAGILSPNGNTYTNPAWPTNNTSSGEQITPVPKGSYVPPSTVINTTNTTNTTSGTTGGTNSTGFQPTNVTPTNNTTSVQPGDVTPIITGNPNPVVNPLVPSGPTVITPSNPVVIIQVPPELNPNNLPPNLDPNYTSSTLLPASPSISAAIEQVIVCNCDCWVH